MSETLPERHMREYKELLRAQEKKEDELKRGLESAFYVVVGGVIGPFLLNYLSIFFIPSQAQIFYGLIVVALGIWLILRYERSRVRLFMENFQAREELEKAHKSERESVLHKHSRMNFS